MFTFQILKINRALYSILIFICVVSALWASCRYANVRQSYAILRGVKVEELHDFPKQDPPIDSASRAIAFALTDPEFVKALHSEHSAPKWVVEAYQLDASSTSSIWKVTAISRSRYARCETSIRFFSDGTTVFDPSDIFRCWDSK